MIFVIAAYPPQPHGILYELLLTVCWPSNIMFNTYIPKSRSYQNTAYAFPLRGGGGGPSKSSFVERSRSCAMPRGSTTDGVPLAQRVADAARALLHGADDALPCSRIALATTDFEELAPPKHTKSIKHFFAAPGDRIQAGNVTQAVDQAMTEAATQATHEAATQAATASPVHDDADANALQSVDVAEQARILEDIARRNKRARTAQPTIKDALCALSRAPKQ